jgi:hypothetical protein
LRQPELLEPRGDVCAGGSDFYIAIDEKDLAIAADVERVPSGEFPEHFQDAVGPGHIFARIAQYGIVEFQGFGELPVGLDIVDAGGEQGDVEPADLLAALTERLAFLGSAPCECLGEPGDHDRPLSLVIGQAVRSAIRAGKSERWSCVSRLEGHRFLRAPECACRWQQNCSYQDEARSSKPDIHLHTIAVLYPLREQKSASLNKKGAAPAETRGSALLGGGRQD